MKPKMKLQFLFSAAGILLVVLVSGCSDANSRANSLLVEARELVERAQTQDPSDLRRINKDLTRAVELLERISKKYPSSAIGIELERSGSSYQAQLAEWTERAELSRLGAGASNNPAEFVLFLAAFTGADFSDSPEFLAATGEFDRAIDAAASADEYAAIAVELRTAGRKDEAEEMFQMAVERAASGSVDVALLSRLGLIKAQWGDGAGAEDLLLRSLGGWHELGDWRRQWATVALAVSFARFGRPDVALRISNEVIHADMSPMERASLLAELAMAFAQGGEEVLARQMVAQARALADQGKVEEQIEIYAFLAQVEAEAGKKREALKLLETARELAKLRPGSVDSQFLAHAQMAEAYQRIGEDNRAHDAYQLCLELAQQMDRDDRSDYLRELGIMLVNVEGMDVERTYRVRFSRTEKRLAKDIATHLWSLRQASGL